LGEEEQAEADLAHAETLGVVIPSGLYEMALRQLASGNVSAWRRICVTLLDRFGRSEDPMALYGAAWPCVLAPDAVNDLEQLLSMVDEVLEDAQTDETLRQALQDAGTFETLRLSRVALFYRAGHVQTAISELSKLDKQWERNTAMEAWERSMLTAYGSFFLAMAHHEMGHPAEARLWLDKGRQRKAEQRVASWRRHLSLELLRHEADSQFELENRPTEPLGSEAE
jgi:hypothetical protein